MISGETTAEILQSAELAGIRITAEVLARHHRRGLVPKPQTRPLRSGRGTESVYPLGTANQLVALERLVKKFGCDYDLIGCLLWEEGYPVDERYWRGPIEKMNNVYCATKDRFTDRDGGIYLADKAMAEIERIAKSRNKLAATGLIRRALHRELFVTLLRAVMEVAIGAFVPSGLRSEPDAEQEFAIGRMLGITPAKKKRKSMLVGDQSGVPCFESMLQTISKKISKLNSTYVSKLQDTEIIDARNEVTMLLNVFCAVEQVQRVAYGRSHPALHLLAEIVGDANVGLRACIILLWTVVRKIPAVKHGAKSFIDEIYFEPKFDLSPAEPHP